MKIKNYYENILLYIKLYYQNKYLKLFPNVY